MAGEPMVLGAFATTHPGHVETPDCPAIGSFPVWPGAGQLLRPFSPRSMCKSLSMGEGLGEGATHLGRHCGRQPGRSFVGVFISIDEWNQLARCLSVRPVGISECFGQHPLLHPDPVEEHRNHG